MQGKHYLQNYQRAQNDFKTFYEILFIFWGVFLYSCFYATIEKLR